MKIQSYYVWCLLVLGILFLSTTPSAFAQNGADPTTLDLTGPEGLVAPATQLEELPEVLPPSYHHPVEPLLPEPLVHEFQTAPWSLAAPSDFAALDPWHNLRIWNLPYGVWVLSNEMDPPQPIRHADPTGWAPACFSSPQTEGELTLYFARSSLDLYNPTQRFEAKVRLVPNQIIDFDFARAGGNTGYGNMVQTNLLAELPTPAKEARHVLPVAAPRDPAPTARLVANDGDAIANLIHCSDLDPSVFSDRLRISFDSQLKVLPAEELNQIRLCQIKVEVSDRQRLTDKWTLHGKLEVHSPGGKFVLKDPFELEVEVASLPTSTDPESKVLVLKETGLSLQVKLQHPRLVDNTIYHHPLFDYLTRLSPATEGTMHLNDVELKLNGVKLAKACTADVSEVRIHFVRE